MTSLVDRRDVAAVTAVRGAALLLGSFAVGVFAARDPTRGVVLIAALACLVVYRTNPQWMAWIALFVAFASLPKWLPLGNGMWNFLGASLDTYQVAVVLAIAFLVPRARLRVSAYVVPGIFLLTVAYFTAAGVMGGAKPEWVNREAGSLTELVAGFVLALLILRTGYVRESIRMMAVVLWFSAGMTLASSMTGLELSGARTRLQEDALAGGPENGAEAIRLLTATATPALAVLAGLVAATIVGRGRLSVYLALGPPALLIKLLAFSRDDLLVLAVAAVAAFVACLGWMAVRRFAVVAAVTAALVAVVVPGALFLLQNTAAGAWLGDQLNAYSTRVLGGVQPTVMAVDPSALSRLRENVHLLRAFGEAPLWGHGLGYEYQLPFGKAKDFSAALGTTYSHNFYLWWLVKAGAVGMASFAVFALTPVVRGIRSASAEAKICAAVSVGLLAGCWFNPMPEEPAESLVLGLALGAALGFARTLRRVEQVEPNGVKADLGASYA